MVVQGQRGACGGCVVKGTGDCAFRGIDRKATPFAVSEYFFKLGLETEVARGDKEKVIGKGGRSLGGNARVCVHARGSEVRHVGV